MTRDKAKEIISYHKYLVDKDTSRLLDKQLEYQAIDMAIKALEQKSNTGHWLNIEDRTDWYDATYKCSCCGREIITPYELKNNLYSDYPYCHCGAKMVELQESEKKIEL